jgi:hypothetical protein
MKKNWLLPLLFYALSGAAQKDNTSIKYFTPHDSSAIGGPVGKMVSKEIGPAGGNLSSEDGRIEMIFPAAALTETKTISIQPVANLFDSAAGTAYQFEPSGLQFKKPVQVIFHYSDEENETCPADLMSFAQQDHNGKWTSLEYYDWDSTAKTLKGNIYHFSRFTNVYKIQIRTAPSVMCNDNVNIEVLDRSQVISSGDLTGQNATATLRLKNQREWFANGVGGGNVYEGYIKDELTSPIGDVVFIIGNYHAPWIFPEKNPVKLSLGIRYYSPKLKQLMWRFCNTKIVVFDAYKIEVSHEASGREGMNAQINDYASFVVAIFPKKFLNKIVSIEQIENKAPVVIRHGKNGPFKETISVAGAEGSIHITDQIKGVKLSRDYPPKVHFEFATDEVLWHTADYSARGIKADPAVIRARPLPPAIDFIANGVDQSYELKAYTITREEKYTMIVKPLSK